MYHNNSKYSKHFKYSNTLNYWPKFRLFTCWTLNVELSYRIWIYRVNLAYTIARIHPQYMCATVDVQVQTLTISAAQCTTMKREWFKTSKRKDNTTYNSVHQLLFEQLLHRHGSDMCMNKLNPVKYCGRWIYKGSIYFYVHHLHLESYQSYTPVFCK